MKTIIGTIIFTNTILVQFDVTLHNTCMWEGQFVTCTCSIMWVFSRYSALLPHKQSPQPCHHPSQQTKFIYTFI